MSADTRAVRHTVHLPPEHAARVRTLAQSGQTTEDQIVVKALDILFSLADVLSPRDERQLLTAVSEESLARVWENDRDAAYDNWRELYGVPTG